MNTRTGLLAAVLASGLLIAGCGGNEDGSSAAGSNAKSATPDGALMAGFGALRDDDLGGFMEHLMPPDMRAQVKDGFAEMANDPISPEAAAQFEMQMAMLTGPDAEQALMSVVEPQLVELQAAMPFVIGMVSTSALSTIEDDSSLSAEEKEIASATVTSIVEWAQNAELTSLDKAEQAIAVVTATACSLDLQTLEQVKALSFDQAMGKASMVWAGGKEVLEVYGLSINDILDSVQVESVTERDNEADVRISFDFLGNSQAFMGTMTKTDDGWYSKEFSDQGEAYEQYQTRTYVSEGLAMAAPAKLASAETYYSTGEFPANNDAAGYVFYDSEIVSDITIAGETITITYASPPEIAGKSIYLTAVASDTGLTWICDDGEPGGKAGDIDPMHKPASCRP